MRSLIRYFYLGFGRDKLLRRRLRTGWLRGLRMGQFRRLRISQLRGLRLRRDIVWTMYTVKIGADGISVEKYRCGRNILIDSWLRGTSMTGI